MIDWITEKSLYDCFSLLEWCLPTCKAEATSRCQPFVEFTEHYPQLIAGEKMDPSASEYSVQTLSRQLEVQHITGE